MRAARASTDNGLRTVSTLAVRATSTSGIDLDRQGRHSRRYVFGRGGNPPVTKGQSACRGGFEGLSLVIGGL